MSDVIEPLSNLFVTIKSKLRGLFSNPTFVANGLLGQLYIKDTGTHTGAWTCFYPTQDVVFDSATVCSVSDLAASGDTFPAGIPIFGNFSTIKLASGAGIAYE